MKGIYLTIVATLIIFSAAGNNVVVSNLSLKSQNSTSDNVLITFDLSWENSWKTTTGPSNWDAVWVFAKFKMGASNWQHAWLNNTGHIVPTGFTADNGLLTPASAFNISSNPSMGVFIYRSASGNGNVSLPGVQLMWNYGVNGVLDSDLVDVQVFAVEMVYVTQGAFVVGDGMSGNNQFTLTTINTATPTTTPVAGGSLGGFGGGYPSGQTAPNASWPNGFNAFYSMKYKVTQQQYVDFLNSLTATQASARFDGNNTGMNRYGIDVTAGVYSTYYPHVACNFLNWADLAAILDWMALRPMTELEYEKACRGAGRTAVMGEFAWGTTVAVRAMFLDDEATEFERPSDQTANCVYGGAPSIQGPIRVGMFATSASSRQMSGATYYGIMEMSGTLWEQPIAISNATGKTFTGTHGNGLLTAAGLSDVSTWPGSNGVGAGNRGGCWVHSEMEMQVSMRMEADGANVFRLSYRGGRGIRTAP
jgi:formylglycine-generating enzyme required for sulfatase activity